MVCFLFKVESETIDKGQGKIDAADDGKWASGEWWWWWIVVNGRHTYVSTCSLFVVFVRLALQEEEEEEEEEEEGADQRLGARQSDEATLAHSLTSTAVVT